MALIRGSTLGCGGKSWLVEVERQPRIEVEPGDGDPISSQSSTL